MYAWTLAVGTQNRKLLRLFIFLKLFFNTRARLFAHTSSIHLVPLALVRRSFSCTSQTSLPFMNIRDSTVTRTKEEKKPTKCGFEIFACPVWQCAVYVSEWGRKRKRERGLFVYALQRNYTTLLKCGNEKVVVNASPSSLPWPQQD